MPTLRSLIRSPKTHLIRVTAAPLVLSALVGCSGPAPTGPGGSPGSALAGKAAAAEAAGYGSASFYPLSVGNRWTFKGGGILQLIHDGSPTDAPLRYAFTETRNLIGTTVHEGTSYVVEEQVHHEIPDYNGPTTWWTRMRQDATGLYFLDTLLSAPPDLESGIVATSASGGRSRWLRVDTSPIARSGRAGIALNRLADRLELLRGIVRGFTPDGLTYPAAGELLELLYPAKVGASWNIRPDMPWPARVDGVESLNTPAGRKTAYRVDINPGGNLVQEGEWVRVWYSREGFLGYSIHTLSVVTGDDGEPTGDTYVADDSMMVASIAIAR